MGVTLGAVCVCDTILLDASVCMFVKFHVRMLFALLSIAHGFADLQFLLFYNTSPQQALVVLVMWQTFLRSNCAVASGLTSDLVWSRCLKRCPEFQCFQC